MPNLVSGGVGGVSGYHENRHCDSQAPLCHPAGETRCPPSLSLSGEHNNHNSKNQGNYDSKHNDHTKNNNNNS